MTLHLLVYGVLLTDASPHSAVVNAPTQLAHYGAEINDSFKFPSATNSNLGAVCNFNVIISSVFCSPWVSISLLLINC